MKLQILPIFLSLISAHAFAANDCGQLAENASRALAKVNRTAVGGDLKLIEASRIVHSVPVAPLSRDAIRETREVTLTDGKSLSVKFRVDTAKDNDELGICAVERVKMEPLF